MPQVNRNSTKAHLAVALAQGVPAGRWARSHGVPTATAYRWAKNPLLRKTIESWRRRTIDHAISLMPNHSTWAAEGIAMIAKEAKSKSLRCRAFRAIVTDEMAVSKYSELEARVADIATRFGKRPRVAAAGTEKLLLNSVPTSAI